MQPIIVIIVLLITVLISANSGTPAYNDRKMVERLSISNVGQ
jgi:hypothetical protein